METKQNKRKKENKENKIKWEAKMKYPNPVKCIIYKVQK